MTTPNDDETPDPLRSEQAEVLTNIQAADAALSDRVEGLRKTLSLLAPQVTKIQNEQKTVWAWVKNGAGLVAFDVIITLLGIVYGFYLHHVEADNHELLNQVQSQQTRLNTSIHETCNLYGTFIGFYSDAAKQRFASGPKAYDQLYITLQNSADHLQCGIKHVVPGT